MGRITMLVVQQASSAEWRRRRTRGGMVKERQRCGGSVILEFLRQIVHFFGSGRSDIQCHFLSLSKRVLLQFINWPFVD